VLARAEAQWSIVRRSDLVALGVHRGHVQRWVASGRLHRLHPGVWTVLGGPLLPRKAEFLAATWWCGGRRRARRRERLRLVRLDAGGRGAPASRPRDDHAAAKVRPRCRGPPNATPPARRRPHLPPAPAGDDEARTLIDRADALDYPALRSLADQPRHLPLAAVERKHARLPGRAGWRRTELLIHSEDARARFALERRLTAYARHHGIRPPDARNEVIAGCEADSVWRAPPVALELDSRAHHARRAEMLQDRARDRRYRRAGFTPVRVMWEELELDDPRVAEELLELVGRA
jgi:very-short-patch-repair endonuclease